MSSDLEAGSHVIKIVATDVAGNVATKEIQFKTEDTKPTVSGVNNKGIADQKASHITMTI